MKKLLIITLLLACACKPTRIPKRFWPLIKQDTVTVVDTVTMPPIRKDSSFYFYQKDTVVLQQKGLTLKYFTHTDSTVYIQGECDSAKYIHTSKTVTKKYPVEKPLPFWVWLLGGACIALFLTLIIRK